jgi:hypothetical protein
MGLAMSVVFLSSPELLSERSWGELPDAAAAGVGLLIFLFAGIAGKYPVPQFSK